MSQPFIGQIMMFAGTFAPAGYLLCDGAMLSIAENDALFTLIGTTYGGDGVTTFALPNLCGRASVGAGTGTGLSPYVLGQTGGTEEVTLTTPQLPNHTHLAATTGTAAPLSGGATPAGAIFADQNGGLAANAYAPAGAAQQALAPGAVTASGSSLPHENRQPYVAISICIAQFGIYPSPS